MPDPRTDESTAITASVTAMVESLAAKGTGWSAGTRFADFTGEAGAAAARAAIEAIGGERVPSGEYAVVFGPQPVADLMSFLVVPACGAELPSTRRTRPSSDGSGSRWRCPRSASTTTAPGPDWHASRRITDEGLPTGSHRPHPRREARRQPGELVRGPAPAPRPRPRREARRRGRRRWNRPWLPETASGRVPAGGGPSTWPPTIAATNVVVEGAETAGRDELLRSVGHGLYIGRIWYTYPVNGLRAGDFTCTVVGDSFLIRDGRRWHRSGPTRSASTTTSAGCSGASSPSARIGRRPRCGGLHEIVYAPEIARRRGPGRGNLPDGGARADGQSPISWRSPRPPAGAACRSSGCSLMRAPGTLAARCP